LFLENYKVKVAQLSKSIQLHQIESLEKDNAIKHLQNENNMLRNNNEKLNNEIKSLKTVNNNRCNSNQQPEFNKLFNNIFK
jgi:hypothetical protein